MQGEEILLGELGRRRLIYCSCIKGYQAIDWLSLQAYVALFAYTDVPKFSCLSKRRVILLDAVCNWNDFV